MSQTAGASYATGAAWLAAQPAATAVALPAALYVDAQLAERERRTIFARSWQLVGRAGQVRAAGDHLVATLAGVPLIVVRGDDGVLRALHNVCRHRAGPLATCDGRGARALTCKYHGWTYALDGQLRGAPAMDAAAAFDPAAVALPRALVAQWQGLLFAALDGAPPFEDVVAGLAQRLGPLAPTDYVYAQRVSYDIACNWKVYVDNFLEGYHLPLVHPALSRVLDGGSYATELARWHVLQSSRLAGGAASPYGGGEALYYWLWPSTMLNLLPERLQTNRVLPLGAQSCRVEFDTWYAPGAAAQAVDGDRALADQVQAEDIAICEAVQRGLASGSYEEGRLNPQHESGVWHFHELVRAAWRAPAEG